MLNVSAFLTLLSFALDTGDHLVLFCCKLVSTHYFVTHGCEGKMLGLVQECS